MKQPRARRAWRKANAYVRSGRHAKAEYIGCAGHRKFSMVTSRLASVSKAGISAIFSLVYSSWPCS